MRNQSQRLICNATFTDTSSNVTQGSTATFFFPPHQLKCGITLVQDLILAT